MAERLAYQLLLRLAQDKPSRSDVVLSLTDFPESIAAEEKLLELTMAKTEGVRVMAYQALAPFSSERARGRSKKQVISRIAELRMLPNMRLQYRVLVPTRLALPLGS